MKHLRFSVCCAAAIAYAAAVQSEGAHVHGEAQAAVVIEGSAVSLSLTSAMYNITGIEHAPQNDDEAMRLAEAIATLERAGDVIVLDPAAMCALVSVAHSLPESPEEAANTDGDHNPYRDLEANYTFECGAPDRLAALTFPLFGQFENLEALDVVVLKDGRQIADSLSGKRNTLAIN